MSDWRGKKSFDDACQWLSDPVKLGGELVRGVGAELERLGLDLSTVRSLAWSNAYIHLPDAFASLGLPDTPTAFCPVPQAEGTLLARATSIASLAAIGLDAVSYGSENNGELFVNLVLMPGEGLYADKSRRGMKGHTDAVSFPVRGRVDEARQELAPSPDFVCLSGVRNPDGVHTTVMPLKDVLAKLESGQIAELKKPQFIIRSQGTFREGMRSILGEEHVVDGGEFLFEVEGQTWVRYSHSSAGVEEEDGPAANAVAAFESACKQSAIEVIVAPGDVLLVNNRLGLHGRTLVAGEPGGQSRWLLRAYGLVTEGLVASQRYKDSPYKLFP
ncbi:TauD/TfdA family dioxygenase [Paraburkholderia sp. BCC1876]|uniref:TauD/TfdA family dioxygenase n=1 Tax=Paraburkholderia sp. BCC1876 TaxID=2676303 RepID=UPI001ABA5576|nr:TauD/TfdA family dioxygenase [Paraburkholderia sp. BCC1876]